MTRVLLLVLFCAVALFPHAQPARILAVIPTASISHQIFFRELWRMLAARGHDMVVVTTDPTGEQLPNFKEISIHEAYEPTRRVMNALMDESIFNLLLRGEMKSVFLELTEFHFRLPQTRAFLDNKTEHFDLLMVEHFPTAYVGLKHRFGCPMIGISSMDPLSFSHTAMGNAVHSVLYPAPLFPFQDNMTWWQRVAVTVFGNVFEYVIWMTVPEVNKMMVEYFGAGTPGIQELLDDTDMLFVNANPLFTAVRPHTPSTISLAGGIHIAPSKPLPNEIKEFLDGANEGAIYFSLGTNVNTKLITNEVQQTFIDALAAVPYKILWKYDNDTMPNKPGNVKITKWAPQQDVLRHKNIKLFITQGGLQSLEEALYTHIPMVVIPFMNDQFANAAKMESKQLGIILDRYKLDAHQLKTAITEVIQNPVYKQNVVNFARRIQDEPIKPMDKAIFWTEYVLRHRGAKHLKGPKIPDYQYYYIDVIAFLGLVTIILLSLVYLIAKLIWKCINCMFNCVTSKDKNVKSKGE